MDMNNNKWKSHTEIPGNRDPGKPVSQKVAPKKRRKSDLTLAFLNSSDYVGTIAHQFSRTDKIHQMRQSAVSNQWTNPVSRKGNMIPTKSQLKAFREVADDPNKAQAITRPSPSPSPGNSPRSSGRRLTRTMTSGTFKKKYSGLAGKTHFGRNTFKPDAQKTMLEPGGTKSKFCPTPISLASINDQISFGDSSEEEENQLPEQDKIHEYEQEMKSQKSNRTVEEVSDWDDPESVGGQEITSIDEEGEENANRD
jgi:hypothetical protein